MEGTGWRREIIYLSPRCHHQNDPCIKTGMQRRQHVLSLAVSEYITLSRILSILDPYLPPPTPTPTPHQPQLTDVQLGFTCRHHLTPPCRPNCPALARRSDPGPASARVGSRLTGWPVLEASAAPAT